MAKNRHDIVYFLKQTPTNEELRYSIRSVVQNFPHRKIVFYGGCPYDMTPDRHVNVVQNKPSKWQNVHYMLGVACKDDDLTPNFWLFNDDFFVMKPVDELPPLYNRSLWRHIVEVEERHQGQRSAYAIQLRHLCRTLTLIDPDTEALNYATHMPMLINRKKALKTLTEFPNEPMFRALYGNHHKIGGEHRDDCKITGWLKIPDYKDRQFLSTTDESFLHDEAGRYIRAQFTEKSRFENG